MQAPGATWYIVGEPNRRAGYGASDIVSQLHDLYTAIKEADPTAKITSPSILNWDFTCLGCVSLIPCWEGGYQSGRLWVEQFRSEYLSRYGTEPPVDIWAIDVYPLDWCNRPTVNAQIAIDQIAAMRAYLDDIPEQRNKPIWITEFALHWGWDDWQWGVPGCNTPDGRPLPSPAGTYQTEQVIQYLRTVFDWLEANAHDMDIERWFTFISYQDITKCNNGAYAGLSLFDGPDPGASLTEVGVFFRNRVLGLGN